MNIYAYKHTESVVGAIWSNENGMMTRSHDIQHLWWWSHGVACMWGRASAADKNDSPFAPPPTLLCHAGQLNTQLHDLVSNIMNFYARVSLSVCLAMCLCLYVCFCAIPYVSLYLPFSLCISVYLHLHFVRVLLFICLSACLPACLSACLSLPFSLTQTL